MAGEYKCDENNSWMIAGIVIFIIPAIIQLLFSSHLYSGIVIFIILLVMFLWAAIWVILVISNPDWIKIINIGQDNPEEDAAPNFKLAGMYSAIITIAIAIILGI